MELSPDVAIQMVDVEPLQSPMVATTLRFHTASTRLDLLDAPYSCVQSACRNAFETCLFAVALLYNCCIAVKCYLTAHRISNSKLAPDQGFEP